MARACNVCTHEHREAIDEALVRGDSNRAIARQFEGVSKDGANRHREHISPALAKVVAQRAEAGPATALERLENLYARANKVLDRAESAGKAAQSLSAIRELRAIVETLAKITGELDERTQVQVLNVTTSEDWLRVRAAILDELGHYPQARAAVAGRLLEIEA